MKQSYTKIVNELSTENLSQKVLLISIFLFPVFSLSIRHWLSGFYAFLFLLSLYFIFIKNKKPLYKEEKVLLTIFVVFLISFFISASLNDWTISSFRRLGSELKYLAFIPIYLSIRSNKILLKYFIHGIILGGIVLGLQALYDTVFTEYQRANGIYGPIIFGDLSVLFYSIIYIKFIYSDKNKTTFMLYIPAIVLSIFAAYLSGNRNAWIALTFSLIVLPLLTPKKYILKNAVFTYGLLAIIIISAIFFAPASIQSRASKAINEFQSYMNPETRYSEIKIIESSVGTRLEQWRVALLIFKERPFFGFGAGNAGREINRYVKLGLAHKDLYNPKHYTGIGGLHSMYFETLVNEGMFGLIIVLSLFLYPLYCFIKYRKVDHLVSSFGIIFILNYMIFGISENPLVHDNFSSFFLVSLAVLFSTFISSKYALEANKLK